MLTLFIFSKPFIGVSVSAMSVGDTELRSITREIYFQSLLAESGAELLLGDPEYRAQLQWD